MEVRKDCRYTKEHEWAKEQQGKVVMGITDYAQHELGDVVFVDLPEVGAKVEKGKSCANVESVKAVSDIYAAVSGVVLEVNEEVRSSPELINSSAFDKAWLVKIDPSNIGELEGLMSAAEYEKYVNEVSK